MAAIIVFGVIALIVIVSLLSFNIKTVSRTEKTELKTKAQQSERSEKQEIKEDNNKMNNKLSPMSDVQYRKALREFNSGQGKRSTVVSQNRLNDSAFRTAARSINKKSKQSN